MATFFVVIFLFSRTETPTTPIPDPAQVDGRDAEERRPAGGSVSDTSGPGSGVGDSGGGPYGGAGGQAVDRGQRTASWTKVVYMKEGGCFKGGKIGGGTYFRLLLY